MSKITVTCDCTSDLSEEQMLENNLGVVYCHIITDSGRFCDPIEISARNVLAYMDAGGIPVTESPIEEDFITLFKDRLKEYDEVIHISLSKDISDSYDHAMLAAKHLGMENRIHVVDSKTLSSATGLIALKAVELVKEGKSSKEVVDYLNEFRNHVSCSFVMRNLRYLYKNNRVSAKAMKMCQKLSLHPVLEMRDGKFNLRSIMFGNYEKAQIKYLNREMKNAEKIDKKAIFITHAGCTVKELEKAHDIVASSGNFENIFITEASATVSCNCGPNTVGVLYVYHD
ncbi:MAG: DegV family EDD domain-containing protein [Lachnospiraceae bacterium]|nr:DegV family EDD domain-containing protein [Lachnospiraceae bacterium]